MQPPLHLSATGSVTTRSVDKDQICVRPPESMSLKQKFAVGARIGMYRKRDSMYFPATIVATHSGFPDCYTFLYDYGEQKTLDLSDVKYKVLNGSIPSNIPLVARNAISAALLNEGSRADDNASDEPRDIHDGIPKKEHRPRQFRLPFLGNEEAAKVHLGLDEIPFLPDIKESLGIDHEFMVIVSEESAHGRDERCRYTQVVDGKCTERSAYRQNLDEVMADNDILEALNFGEELVIPKGQSFIALSRHKGELVPVVMGVHMDNISNCVVDEGTIAGKWHKRKAVSHFHRYLRIVRFCLSHEMSLSIVRRG